MRCDSPPLKVLADRPNDKYPRPTLSMKRRRCTISGINSPAIVFCFPVNFRRPIFFAATLAESPTTSGTTHFSANDGDSIFRVDEPSRAPTDLECALAQVARLGDAFFVDHSDNDINAVFLETLEFSEICDWNELPIDKKCVES